MIAHQAIAGNFQPIPFALLFKELQIYSPVVIDKENVLTVVAPLSDMMRTSDRDRSG